MNSASGSYTHSLTPYLRAQIMSATPGQLIVLLYDGMIRFLDAANNGFSVEDITQKFEAVNNNLIRAHAIVTELNSCLDMDQGGDVARQLRDVYYYVEDQITRVNVTKDPSALPQIIRILSELRDAWDQVVRSGDRVHQSRPATTV